LFVSRSLFSSGSIRHKTIISCFSTARYNTACS
jgi:hypothetical protein